MDWAPQSSSGAFPFSLPQPELSTMRVNQLDAGVLDSELHGLLKTQLGRACTGLPAGTLERFRPEVDALFNLLMFRFTVWIQRPTPGMHLQVCVFTLRVLLMRGWSNVDHWSVVTLCVRAFVLQGMFAPS